jgi:hypothetical protein
MGTDNLFRKRRERDKNRKSEYKKVRANSFLIVTEGKETEPSYFGGIRKLIIEKCGGNIDIYETPTIAIKGEGKCTSSLVKTARERVKEGKVLYQNKWVVFDKDSFEDFDEAIEMAEKEGFKVAWSNQSFEYWLYLHFHYSDSALHRDSWSEKLSEKLKASGIEKTGYEKNDKDIYRKVDTYDGVNTAIKYAKSRMEDFFEKKGIKPSEYDPGTTVHLLVEELIKYLEE